MNFQPIRWLVFALLPLIVFGLIGPGYIAIRAGEWVRIKDLAELQTLPNTKTLYNPTYLDKISYLKFVRLSVQKPEVFVLGTSRALQVRSNFFQDKTKFYNAALTVSFMRAFPVFLERILRDFSPKIIILSLDQDFFNANVKRNWLPIDQDEIVKDSPVLPLLWAYRRSFYQDFFEARWGKTNLFSISADDLRYGFRALKYHTGYRNDGSYRYIDYKFRDGDLRINRPAERFADEIGYVQKGENRMAYGKEPSAKLMGECEDVLKKCSEKGIHVIGYFPPYAPILFQAMQEQGERYAYLSKTAQGLTELFQRYQGSFFDFSDTGAMGGTDEEALDGTHGSEKTFLRIFIVMAKKDSRLATYVDVNYLEQRLREARHQRQIFVEDN